MWEKPLARKRYVQEYLNSQKVKLWQSQLSWWSGAGQRVSGSGKWLQPSHSSSPASPWQHEHIIIYMHRRKPKNEKYKGMWGWICFRSCEGKRGKEWLSKCFLQKNTMFMEIANSVGLSAMWLKHSDRPHPSAFLIHQRSNSALSRTQTKPTSHKAVLSFL